MGPPSLGPGVPCAQALPLLGKTFFVMYGDSYLECDYDGIEQAFWVNGNPGLMTVYRNHDQWDRSNVLFHGGRILCYDKKHRTPDMQHIDYGLGVLRAESWKFIRMASRLIWQTFIKTCPTATS